MTAIRPGLWSSNLGPGARHQRTPSLADSGSGKAVSPNICSRLISIVFVIAVSGRSFAEFFERILEVASDSIEAPET